jgi:hypothetical protein
MAFSGTGYSANAKEAASRSLSKKKALNLQGYSSITKTKKSLAASRLGRWHRA